MTVRTGPAAARCRGVSAGFDRDDIGADGSHPQCCGDACVDVAGVHGPVQEKDVDEFTGSVGVAIDATGGGPECLVGAGERPGLSRPGQSGGAGEGAGFGFEDFEIVVQLDRLTGPGGDPLMPGDHGAAIEHHDLGGPQRYPDPPADETGRDGVFHHPDRDHRGPIDPRVQHQARIKFLGWQGGQEWPFDLEVLAYGADSVVDPPVLVLGFPSTYPVVELVQGVSDRHRGEPVAAEPAHLALHAALFVRPGDAGLAIEGVEAVFSELSRKGWLALSVMVKFSWWRATRERRSVGRCGGVELGRVCLRLLRD